MGDKSEEEIEQEAEDKQKKIWVKKSLSEEDIIEE